MANFPTVGIAGRVSLFVAVLVATQANALPSASALAPLAHGTGPQLLESGAKFFNQQQSAKPMRMNATHCALAICAGAMLGFSNGSRKEEEDALMDEIDGDGGYRVQNNETLAMMDRRDGDGGNRVQAGDAEEYSYEIQRRPSAMEL